MNYPARRSDDRRCIAGVGEPDENLDALETLLLPRMRQPSQFRNRMRALPYTLQTHALEEAL